MKQRDIFLRHSTLVVLLPFEAWLPRRSRTFRTRTLEHTARKCIRDSRFDAKRNCCLSMRTSLVLSTGKTSSGFPMPGTHELSWQCALAVMSAKRCGIHNQASRRRLSLSTQVVPSGWSQSTDIPAVLHVSLDHCSDIKVVQHFLNPPPLMAIGDEFGITPSHLVPILVAFCLGVVCTTLALQFQQKHKKQPHVQSSSRQILTELSRLGESEILELVEELPSWLTSRDFERGGWLNKVLSAAWPYLDKATSNVIVCALDPILRATRPSFLTSLQFERFSFGSVPAIIESVKVYEITGEGAVEIDLQVSWAGDPDVVLGVRAAQDTLAVPVSLTEVQCKFTLRLIFAPLIGKFPCFGALTIALTEDPEVVFDLRVVGGDITLVPGLAQPLRTYIKALISSYLVWPRCITVPIPGTGYTLPSSDNQQDHSGLLHVEVISHNLLTAQPGELGLEVCWPGVSTIEEARVKALSHGSMNSLEPISLRVTDPRYQVLKLKWYGLCPEEGNVLNIVEAESVIVLEDLVRLSLSSNKYAISDVAKSWGPITLVAELDPVKSDAETIPSVSGVQNTNPPLTRRVSNIWKATKGIFVKKRVSTSTIPIDASGNHETSLNDNSGAKMIQLTLHYQALQCNVDDTDGKRPTSTYEDNGNELITEVGAGSFSDGTSKSPRRL
jgi:hypothetical protein